jgi:serine/threonine protein kinase
LWCSSFSRFRFDRDRPDMKVIDAPPPRLPEYTAPEQLIDERQVSVSQPHSASGKPSACLINVIVVVWLQVTYSSDVYSLAILFVEVLSGKRGLVWEGAPASSRSSFLFKQWIKTAAIAGIRPEIPVATPEAVKVIIQFAWTRHPEERSTLEQFRDSLEAVTARVHDLSGLTTTVIDLP